MGVVVTPKFRANWVNLFKARAYKPEDTPMYSCDALFEKGADLTALKNEVQKEIVKKWGADKNKWPKNLYVPFRDQSEAAKEVNGKQVLPKGYTEGAVYMKFKSKDKPGIVDQQKNEILDTKEIYSGCWLRASINIYAYSNKGNSGVTCQLNNIQKVADGEPLGNRTTPEHDFSPIESDAPDAKSATDIFN